MQMTVQPSGRRAGATWVASTGAFLLVVAAAVFVAVQWNRLGSGGRLLVVAAVTAGCLWGGRALRTVLPATGDVVFHLGAFLLPVDLAALALQADLGWPALVLAEGALGAVVLGGLGVGTGSVVLRWTGAAAVPVLAAGVAAHTPVPAPVALAVVAVVADLSVGRRAGRAPVVWAATAGLAPVLGGVVALAGAVVGTTVVHTTVTDPGQLSPLGAGTLGDLGLAGGSQVLGAPLAGVLSAWVLAAGARRRREPTLAFLSMASIVVGLVASALAADLSGGGWAVGLAATFLVAEVLALGLRHDPFWVRLLAAVGAAAEVAAGAVTALIVQAAVYSADWGFTSALGQGQERAVALSFTLAFLAWIAADLRRYRGTPRPAGVAFLRGGGWEVGTAAAAASAVLAVMYATASRPAAAAALVAAAALAVAGRRPSAGLLAGLAGPWAFLNSPGHPLAGPVVTLMAAAVAAVAAVDRSGDDAVPGADTALALCAAASACLAAALALPLLSPAAVVAIAGASLWMLAAVLDRGHPRLGDLARTALVLPAAAAVLGAPRSTLLATAFVVGLLVADTVRLDRPSLGARAGVAVQGLVVQVAVSVDLSAAETGLALCVTAVAWAGLAAVVDDRWRPPFAVAAGCALGLGVVLAAADPEILATALIVAGGLFVTAGVVLGRPLVGHAGGVLASTGLVGHLALAGVGAAEPYVAPVALQMGVAGWRARRRRGVPSWTAYGPGIALLGGVALAQRLAGGPGWHAVVAGTVGVGAVAVGGWRRLLGPLLIGTALVVAATVSESLSALAGVPTWAWLASAGAFLVTVGVVLERADTTPAEAGRRLVDVLAERYD
ncbi:MAG TPA: hypothetical protein VHF24_04390 [Acidimicrobiales bacterium]|nr:hypothetical protein [Acidimicrobiales bacterium]